MSLRNQLERWLCDEKPEDNAISAMGMSLVCRSFLARSTLRRNTY